MFALVILPYGYKENVSTRSEDSYCNGCLVLFFCQFEILIDLTFDRSFQGQKDNQCNYIVDNTLETKPRVSCSSPNCYYQVYW